MRRPGSALTALAEVRRLDVEAQAQRLSALSSRVQALEASHEAGRAAVAESALELGRAVSHEAGRLERKGARIADLQRGADYFKTARSLLEERRSDVDRKARLLDAGRAELELAREGLRLTRAEKKATDLALQRRDVAEKRRAELAFEEEGEDFVRARMASREGGLQ